MIALITTIHILTAIILVFAVLMESSKGSDVAGAFGGMGSQAAFGPRGTATFLSKATVILAVVFVVTSMTLVRMGTDSVGGGDSVLSGETVEATPSSAAPATVPDGVPMPTATVTQEAPAGSNQPQPQVQSIQVNTPPAGSGASAPSTPAPAPAGGQQ